MVQATYLDGRSTRLRPVTLSLDGADLVIAGEEIHVRTPFARVKVDERLGSAARRLRLENGAICEVRDLAGLDALLEKTAHRDGWTDRMQRNTRFALAAAVGFIALALVTYKWLLPWSAAAIADRLPLEVGEVLSAQTLKILDDGFFEPTDIAPDEQEALAAGFQDLQKAAGGKREAKLLFRQSKALGANAFALPDGTVIVLDGLVTIMADEREILAVLAHELGHVHSNDGLRILLESSAMGAFLAFYVGDFSTLLVAAPAAVLQAKYSQTFESRADDYAAALLTRNGMSPALLADALEKLAASHPETKYDGYLSSHPRTEERMRHLREWRGPSP